MLTFRFTMTDLRTVLRPLLALGVAAAGTLAPAGPAGATDPQPVMDTNVLKRLYQPVGYFKPGDAVPAADAFDTAIKPQMSGLRFNPSGTYNAFDNNVFEVLSLPFRNAGDTSAADPYGNGGNPVNGFCGPDTGAERRPGNLARAAGKCPNHQLEYVRYYEETMRDILGDFGMTFKRYRFRNPGSDNTSAGTAINPAAVVPGADHPEETVIIGAHYDQTTEGPASAWDSAEGHAQVIRVAKIMADYWRATGTRPAATVKFIPWDGEESGTLGSTDYVANNIVPGEESKVRGYWNTDPCAGGYPAFRRGNPADRINLGIQLANPDRAADPLGVFSDPNLSDDVRPRIEAFNETAQQVLETAFTYLDDELTLPSGKVKLFVARGEAAELGQESDIGRDVVIGNARPVLFSSDWKNFEDKGIPFFNPGPEVTGPSSQSGPDAPDELGNADGLAILHTPNDNLRTLNAMTSGPDNSDGGKFSEGWIKGMEMCAHLLGSGMLQPTQGGAQQADGGVVAYYEALPNEATAGEPVRFDAAGSYQYAEVATRRRVTAETLSYRWDFGDGETATGERAPHTYRQPGVYVSTLTVSNPATGESDTMTVPITVTPAPNPELEGPVLSAPASDPDGTFDLTWTTSAGDPVGYEVEESTDVTVLLSDDAEGTLADRWGVEGSGAANRAQPWQKTSATTRAPAGNKSRSGASSYWSGIFPADPPSNFRSALTLKTPVQVPDAGDTALSYWSYYRNDLTDLATVEVAIDDGSTEPDWQIVDQIRGDDQTAYHPGLDVALNGSPAVAEGLEPRRVDLSSFAGQRILVRFVNTLTTRDGVFVTRNGWYIDDVQLESASFRTIASPAAPQLTVTGRGPGTYAYRVRGVYEDGLLTAPSNVGTVRVGG